MCWQTLQNFERIGKVPSMNKIIAGASFAIAAVALGAYGIIQSGAISVAADEPHSETVTKLIGWVREGAIARASAGITVPQDLANPERIRHGAGNYDAMCADCHLAPEKPDTEIRQGLYPAPPDLSRAPADADAQRSATRRFWIIKHGIKGSAMAAWSKGGMEDEAIWNLVAFLGQLPQLSPPAYAELVALSDGHSHNGLELTAYQQAPDGTAAAPTPKAAKAAKPPHQHTHDHNHAPHAH